MQRFFVRTRVCSVERYWKELPPKHSVLPVLAQLADRHEGTQQQVAHETTTRSLEIIHEGKSALADRSVDGVRHDDGEEEEDVVE